MGGLTVYKNMNITVLSEENTPGLFNERKTNPKSSESIMNLQLEFIDAWKIAINSAISLQCEYATKCGFSKNDAEFILQHVHEMIDVSIRAYIQQNKNIARYAEDMLKKDFVTFNENTESFFALNEEIMEYLMSSFKQKSNAQLF